MSMELVFSINFFILRYVRLRISKSESDFLIFQFPFDSLDAALCRRYAVRLFTRDIQ